MALDPVVNFFRSTIATLPVASGGTSIVITTGDGAKLPDPAVDGNFNLTIYNEDDPFDAPEIVRVTAIAGDTLTVTRAQEGTSATNKTSGNTWYLELTPTAKTIQDIDTAKLDVADVVNNLTSTDTDKALSANQGKVLQDNKEPADATILKEADIVDTLVSTSTTAPLSANQGKVLQDAKINLSGGTMTGDLTIPDKIIHSGDTNTAIRFPAADTVAIETAGVERMKVTSAGVSTSSDYIFSGTNNYLFSTDGVNGVTGINVASSSNFVALLTTNTERMRITSAGNVGIGTTTPATKLDVTGAIRTSTGILFGTDTAAANTLDDYEEGVWTPELSSAGGTPTGTTYNSRNATYTKVGRAVTVTGGFQLSNKGSGGSGETLINGLPFTQRATGAYGEGTAAVIIGVLTTASLNNRLDCFVQSSGTNFRLRLNENDAELPLTEITNTTYIKFTATYFVA